VISALILSCSFSGFCISVFSVLSVLSFFFFSYGASVDCACTFKYRSGWAGGRRRADAWRGGYEQAALKRSVGGRRTLGGQRVCGPRIKGGRGAAGLQMIGKWREGGRRMEGGRRSAGLQVIGEWGAGGRPILDG